MKAKILIVEDDKTLSEAYELILGNTYKTAVAYDGGQALKIIEDFRPNLVLLDLRMPRVSGIEFLRQYNPSKHPDVKIIVFTRKRTSTKLINLEPTGIY